MSVRVTSHAIDMRPANVRERRCDTTATQSVLNTTAGNHARVGEEAPRNCRSSNGPAAPGGASRKLPASNIAMGTSARMTGGMTMSHPASRTIRL